MKKTKEQEVDFLAVSELDSKMKATLKQFDCDDKYLNKVARISLVKQDKQDLLKGVVAVSDERIVGYMTTKVGILTSEFISAKGLPRELPVICLEHIATDVDYRNQNIGKRLLQRALRVTVDVSKSAGVYGLMLWSHPEAVSFYKRHSFVELTTKSTGAIELTLMFLPVEAIRKASK